MTEDEAAPAIDYQALIEYGWERFRYRQGTKECVAFAKGAEWMREQALAAYRSTSAGSGGEALPLPPPLCRDDTQHVQMADERIREVFLSHGFTIKDGHTDLKPYVYAAARALLRAAAEQGR